MKLREYQHDALRDIERALESNQSVLAVMPTGTGKTIVFAHLINNTIARRGRCMVIAHREELIMQAAEKIKAIVGREASIEKAAMQAGATSSIIVSSIQTLNAMRAPNAFRMHRFNPFDFDLIIIDEAHHAPSPTYRRVAKYFRANPKLKLLGVTATPDRLDRLALGSVFDAVAYEYELRDAIGESYLVPIHQRRVWVDSLDFSQIRKSLGDFNRGELARLMEVEQNLYEVASPTLQETAGGQKTLIFTASVWQAKRLCEIINRKKPDSAAFVCDKTKPAERREIFTGFASGKYQYLCNVGIATEGFDCPGIEVVVVARPTQSRALYAQMIGRGTRVLPGLIENVYGNSKFAVDIRRDLIAGSKKPRLLVLDFAGNSGQHKLVTAVDILAGKHPPEVIERAKNMSLKQSIPIEEALQRAVEIEERRQKQRNLELEELRQRKLLWANAVYSSEHVDPFDVLDIKPQKKNPRFVKPLTPGQMSVVKKSGINIDSMNMSELRQLFFELIRRIKMKLCTYRQARILKMHGHKTDNMTMDEASRLIESIYGQRQRGVPDAVAKSA